MCIEAEELRMEIFVSSWERTDPKSERLVEFSDTGMTTTRADDEIECEIWMAGDEKIRPGGLSDVMTLIFYVQRFRGAVAIWTRTVWR